MTNTNQLNIEVRKPFGPKDELLLRLARINRQLKSKDFKTALRSVEWLENHVNETLI